MVLLNLAQQEWGDLNALTAALQRRFGSMGDRELLRARFRRRVRSPGESLAKLASNLEREARRAYADSPAREQEEQARFQFVEAVGPGELRKHLRLSKPRSLQEAFQLAQEWEHISKEEDEHRSRPAVRATEVEVGPEQSGLGLAEVMEEIVAIRKAMAARPPPSPQSDPVSAGSAGNPGIFESTAGEDGDVQTIPQFWRQTPRGRWEMAQAQEWEDISKEEDEHRSRPAVRATEVEVGPEQSGLGLAEVMEEIVAIRKAMAARPPPSPQSDPVSAGSAGNPGIFESTAGEDGDVQTIPQFWRQTPRGRWEMAQADGSKPTFPCTPTDRGLSHRSHAISSGRGSCLTALGKDREDPPCAP
ncbi:UNVERIFIED_CONTAM: hypothetical protein FKN15_070172 [Acipenser sinensis]